MRRLDAFCAILILSSLTACNYRYEKVPQAPEGVPTVTDVNFVTVEKHVLEPKCASCHNASTDFDICSYNIAFALKDSILHRINSTGSDQMPPPGAPALSPEEKSLLMEWIAAGAPK